MAQDNIFLAALQSALLLGLIHGINPCGHSWLMLAPFVVGDRDGRRVFTYTAAFLLGTTLACLLIGLSLGAVSSLFTPGMGVWVDLASAGIVLLLGFVLLVKPDLLHHHDHEGEHDHHDDHGHDHARATGAEVCLLPGWKSGWTRATGLGLFVVGFVNMIVPCPTVAVMYTYAIRSGSALRSLAVFGVYALTTAIAVGSVIFGIQRMSRFARSLEKPWLEGALMRGVGLMTMAFGAYSLWTDLRTG